MIGQGVPLDIALKRVGMVVEGVNTLPAALRLAEKYGVELPIIQTVDQVLNHGMPPKAAVDALMGRAKKAE